MMRLGAIADDITGACDLAGRVAETGMPARVLLGAPRAGEASDADDLFPHGGDGLAVIALKIRTAPVEHAVDQAGRAAAALLGAGATLLYQKYCSTFDSTADGNIGPVAEALAAAAGAFPAGLATVGTPATPAADRTQYAGTLFVDGVPLAESSLRDHPLTPMRDSNVGRLLGRQATEPVSVVRWEEVRRGPSHLYDRLRSTRGHVLADALGEADLDTIAAAVLMAAADGPIVAGGAAGLGTALAREARRASGTSPRSLARLRGVPVTGRLTVAGSASAATRAQIAEFDGETHTIDPSRLARPGGMEEELHRLLDLVGRVVGDAPLLVHAPSDVATVQEELGIARAASLIETALAEFTSRAVHDRHVSHVIVAGGETSGAVTAALGVRRLRVGAQAAPGVPWAVGRTAADHRVALLLKSGNFGGSDLFTTAWEVAP